MKTSEFLMCLVGYVILMHWLSYDGIYYLITTLCYWGFIYAFKSFENEQSKKPKILTEEQVEEIKKDEQVRGNIKFLLKYMDFDEVAFWCARTYEWPLETAKSIVNDVSKD